MADKVAEDTKAAQARHFRQVRLRLPPCWAKVKVYKEARVLRIADQVAKEPVRAEDKVVAAALALDCSQVYKLVVVLVRKEEPFGFGKYYKVLGNVG